jgi:hypothetical protein
LTFLPTALTYAGIKIHDSGCYHTIVWAEEYAHVGQTGSKTLVRVWLIPPKWESDHSWHHFESGAHRST